LNVVRDTFDDFWSVKIVHLNTRRINSQEINKIYSEKVTACLIKEKSL